MKIILISVLFSAITATCLAAEAVGYFKDPAHPDKCFISKDLILSPGDEGKEPNICNRILCGKDSFATIQTCGVVGISENCHFGDYIDISKNYPDCCEQHIICDDD